MYDDDLTVLDDSATIDAVVDVAIEQFAELGFQDTRLDSIAKESGMSKRMIHYHFGDKKGLYLRCLSEAAHRVQPPADEIIPETLVPVEGVTRLVEAVYSTMISHPESVRLLSHEGLHRVLNITGVANLVPGTHVSLQLDKLLMQGQDAGAFRPGIGAEDIFYLLFSLAFTRVAHRDLMVNLVDVDTMSKENTAGIGRLAVDTVLALLTANITHSGDSYLTADRLDEDSQTGLGIYADESDIE
ncbi:MAG: TetR/AcrR family transcriptional regulator [Corynebacterium sp.]|uniref:TetR/AcrR family transcriptional regulator n=1 Tax=Corynebacterium sp. TaxID=1720 RepID=UPI0026DEC38A|nr:TetR/AcrR family transcriptional regulator [Corynebacterium sp.]MDO5670682.1 TetR/AcrR family transcriptional regulator [Corynebacterium sp.]